MRIAALYDIHGNLPALEAVLKELESLKPDQIVIGGDVLPGPMPVECLERLIDFKHPVHYIKGNGEETVLDQLKTGDPGSLPKKVVEQIRWTADVLTTELHEFISGWPNTLNLKIEGIGNVLFCHATPNSPTQIFTIQTPMSDLQSIFDLPGTEHVVCGHTHMQFDRLIGNTRVLNAGSLGMPFGKPGAYWLLLDNRFDLRYTYYDLEEAARRIKKTDYPSAGEFAENHVLNPPTEEQMLEVLGK